MDGTRVHHDALVAEGEITILGARLEMSAVDEVGLDLDHLETCTGQEELKKQRVNIRTKGINDTGKGRRLNPEE